MLIDFIFVHLFSSNFLFPPPFRKISRVKRLMVQEKITLRSKPSFDETFILSSSQMMEKNVFVTVGTTEFVELIKTATSDDILKVWQRALFS